MPAGKAVVGRRGASNKLNIDFKRKIKQISDEFHKVACSQASNGYAKHIPMHSAAQQKTFQQSLHTCILFEDMKAIVLPLGGFWIGGGQFFFLNCFFVFCVCCKRCVMNLFMSCYRKETLEKVCLLMGI